MSQASTNLPELVTCSSLSLVSETVRKNCTTRMHTSSMFGFRNLGKYSSRLGHSASKYRNNRDLDF